MLWSMPKQTLSPGFTGCAATLRTFDGHRRECLENVQAAEREGVATQELVARNSQRFTISLPSSGCRSINLSAPLWTRVMPPGRQSSGRR
jgi:hypothetical protein